MQSIANIVQFLTKLEPQKHLEINSHMESAMINQMNQLTSIYYNQGLK
jgi:hypothetical protein